MKAIEDAAQPVKTNGNGGTDQRTGLAPQAARSASGSGRFGSNVGECILLALSLGAATVRRPK